MANRSLTMKKRWQNSEYREHMVRVHKESGRKPPSRKGMKSSEETIRKLIESHKGKKRPPFSKDWKKNMSEAKKGRIGYWRGKRRPTGEKSSNWKGGITSEHLKIRSSIEFRLWREAVFARDNFTCQKCGDNKGHNLNSHHIQNFSQYPELRTSIENGITFCRNCHKEFHKIYGKANNNKEQINDYIHEEK